MLSVVSENVNKKIMIDATVMFFIHRLSKMPEMNLYFPLPLISAASKILKGVLVAVSRSNFRGMNVYLAVSANTGNNNEL